MQDQFQNQNVGSYVSCFYSFFQRAQEESWYVYTLAKTLFRILIPHGESS